jgi:thioredoxin reductase
MNTYDVVVIGGGPAGLAAAIAAKREGANTLLIEREARLGGILKQCIHDGFGLVRFFEKLSGPEYAERFIDEFNNEKIKALTLTFVTQIKKADNGFDIKVVNRNGVDNIKAASIILATGCRERTAKQVFIHGTRPAGIFTAGTAQHFTNLLGQMPTKKCVILGSGDIGLIMARRLTLEGAQVVGVYEAKPTPSGLTRNIHQCLNDYNIPLYLSHTVTRVFGDDRLTAVEISQVDENIKPIENTGKIVECDALILSVGLIPENELAESLNVRLDPKTKGPVCDANLMTSVEGVFSCGNALNVNDLVDYVSESGELAGSSAARYSGQSRELIEIDSGKGLLCLVPQQLDLKSENKQTVMYFRSRDVINNCRLTLTVDGQKVFEKKYAFLRPPEMERLMVDFNKYNLSKSSQVSFDIEEGKA